MRRSVDTLLIRFSPHNFRRTIKSRYGFALAAVCAVSLLAILVDETLGEHGRPLTLMVLGVVLSTWFGGLGPGIFATALSSVIADGFLLGPSILEEAAVLNLGIFVIVSLITASLYEALRAAKGSEEHLREEVIAADELVGFVSHELRNPTAIIMGNLSLLSRQPLIQGNETLEATVTVIKKEAADLAGIIDHLLVLSTSGEHSATTKQPVLLPRLLAAQIRDHQARFPQRPIEMTCLDSCALAEANEEHLRLILRNLLDNAEKYSPNLLAPIDVVMRSTSPNEVAICVLDRGLGVQQTEIESVFESFYRSDSVKATRPGFGLGLAVCKRLAEAGGGQIWALPRPGGGSEFCFTVQPLKLRGDEGI